MANTITSANAIYSLAVDTVFPAPQTLQGFGTDDAFTTEAADATEVQIGVDGVGVAGYVPRAYTQTINFLASSASIDIFEEWMRAMDTLQDVLYASGSIRLASVGKVYTLLKGTLNRFPPVPAAHRVLQPRQFQIIWLPNGQGQPAITSSPI